MNLAVWSNRSSLISLCLGCAAVKTALLHTSLWGITTVCKVCGVFHEGKTKYNYALKKLCPCPTYPAARNSQSPQGRDLRCSIFLQSAVQAGFMPRRKRPCACIYKGLRFSNQAHCKKECRESLFAETGSEEMRTSERQTTE